MRGFRMWICAAALASTAACPAVAYGAQSDVPRVTLEDGAGTLLVHGKPAGF